MTQGLEQNHLNRCGYHFGNMVSEKTRQGTVPSYIEVFSNNSQLPPSFNEMGGPTYQTP